MFFIRFFVVAIFCTIIFFNIPDRIVCNVNNFCFEFSRLILVFGILAVFLLLELIHFIIATMKRKFVKRKIEKFSTSIESAIECMINEKNSDADKMLDVAEKSFGEKDNVLIDWIRGCNKLMMNQNQEAKSFFYKLTYFKSSFLGAYSLYKLHEKENHYLDSYNVLDYLTSKFGVKKISEKIAKDLIKNELINNDFKRAIDLAKEISNNRLIGIAYFLEDSHSINNLKTSFEYAPEIPEISVKYVDQLCLVGEFKKAKKCLLKAWNLSFNPIIFEHFTRIAKSSSKSVIDFLRPLIEKESYEGFFAFADVLYENDMLPLAYSYFRKAFAIYKSESCAKKILDLSDKLNKNDLTIDLSCTFKDPCWKCQICGFESNDWSHLCKNCNSLDSFSWWKFKNHFNETSNFIDLIEKR